MGCKFPAQARTKWWGREGENPSSETAKTHLCEPQQVAPSQPRCCSGSDWVTSDSPFPPVLGSVPGCPSSSEMSSLEGTLPSCRSEREQASMKACAITERQASMWSVLSMSKTNWGFFRMLTQNLRGRLQRKQARNTQGEFLYSRGRGEEMQER